MDANNGCVHNPFNASDRRTLMNEKLSFKKFAVAVEATSVTKTTGDAIIYRLSDTNVVRWLL